MVEERTSRAGNISKREIVITRVFDAPREIVFEAIADQKQVVEWWRPRGLTTTIHEADLRPGGTRCPSPTEQMYPERLIEGGENS